MNEKKNYDAIIIGAGIGGMATANYLSKKGKKVLVLEQHSTPGGYICGFKRKNYYFDGANNSFSSHGIIFPMLKELGIDSKLNFKLHKNSVSVPNIKLNVSYKDFDTFRNALAKAFAYEKNIGKYLDAIQDFYNFFNILEKYPVPIVFFGMERVFATFAYFKVLFEKGIFKIIKSLMKYGRLDCEQFAGKFFPINSDAYNFFSNYGNPRQSAMILGAMVSEFIKDKWYPEHGEQYFADTMVKIDKELGAEFQYKTLVTKIKTEKGKAIGVSTNKGDYFAKYVISDTDYRKTFNKLIDRPELVPAAFKERMQTAWLSEPIFNIYIGAKYTQNEIQDALQGNHMFYIPELKPRHFSEDVNTPDFFKHISISIFVPSMLSPDIAQPGCSSIIVQCFCPNKWMDNWGNGNKEEYKRLKDIATKDIMDNVRQVLPNIDERIEIIETASPVTYERYSLNSDGAFSAWSWENDKSFFKDLKIHIETPVENLFCCSDWCYKLGGLVGALVAAKMIAHKIG
jgi:phytoene dehydrogenase-like protein